MKNKIEISVHGKLTYEEFLEYLYSQKINRIDLGLERIKSLLDKLGNPQDKLKYIHVAGTNGKGSVCAMLTSCLSQKYKVGMYTSPHLVDYRERIQIFNQGRGEKISKEDVLKLFKKISPYLEGHSYFEITTALAFLYFLEKNTDIVILETGLGGRLDATNVVIPEISVITRLDIDHNELLGDNIEQITKEKAGIIKKNIPVVISKGNNKKEIIDIIKDKAKETSSMIYIADEYNGELSLKGSFQKENSGIVAEVLKHIKKFSLDDEQIKRGLRQAYWPARLEWKNNILIDGAHNVSGITELVKYVNELKEENKIKKVNILCAFIETKDYTEMIKLLNGIADNIIITTIPDFKYADPDELLSLTDKGIVVLSPFQALKTIKELTMDDETIIITGSLYLIGKLYQEV